MQLKRLWETLTYFDVFPFFTCWQKLFNSPRQNLFKIKMNYTLINNNQSELATKTINYLTEKSVNLKIINDEKQGIINKKIVEINQDDISILERVNTIICFPEKGINNLINLVNKHLQPTEILLFNFINPSQEIKTCWGAVDDVVMGGVSESNITLANGKAIFGGIVSTDNNGGFASVRSKNFSPPWDLSSYEGIKLRIQGDGKRYKFITRCEGKWDGVSYCYSFDTLANVWMTVDIPFTDLIPVFRAKTLKDAGKFNSSQVYSFQLMLSKFEYDGAYNPRFQRGVFALEIESIKAYGVKNSLQLIFMGNTQQWHDFDIQTPFPIIYRENLNNF